jgi:hypothetical protein
LFLEVSNFSNPKIQLSVGETRSQSSCEKEKNSLHQNANVYDVGGNSLFWLEFCGRRLRVKGVVNGIIMQRT